MRSTQLLAWELSTLEIGVELYNVAQALVKRGVQQVVVCQVVVCQVVVCQVVVCQVVVCQVVCRQSWRHLTQDLHLAYDSGGGVNHVIRDELNLVPGLYRI